MNLSGFKKLKEDKKTVTMGHPQGHTITIAKSAVSPIQRKQLERLPLHLADGDPSVSLDGPSSSVDTGAADQIGNFLGVGPQDQQVNQSIASTPQSAQPSAVSAPIPSSNNVPISSSEVGPQNQSQNKQSTENPIDINASYNQGQRAIREQQDVATKLAQSNVNIQQQDIQDRQALNDSSKQNAADFMQHQKQLLSDYSNGHINPTHFQENMGTGQKVATAIGLLLGGFAGGFNHTGVNPAADWLNGQINRDIEAQRSSLDQKKTILGANQDLYHDQQLADNTTRMNMNDIYNHQIQLAANKLGTPQAKAAADQQSSKFALENANLLQQNAIRSSVLQQLKNGNTAIGAVDLVNADIIPKEYQEQALKEQGSVDAQKNAIQSVQSLYNRLNAEQSSANLLNPQSYARVAALKSELVNTVMNASASKRLTRESVEQEINPLLTGTFNDKSTRAAKQADLLNIVKNHADPTPLLARYSPGSLPKYPQQQAEIKTVNGVKYQRGPNGEAIKVQ